MAGQFGKAGVEGGTGAPKQRIGGRGDPHARRKRAVTETSTLAPIMEPFAPVKQRKLRTVKATADTNPSQVVNAAPDSITSRFGKAAGREC
jgi:hypothetical protein